MRRLAALTLLAAVACSDSGTGAGVAELSGKAPEIRAALIAGGTFEPAAYRGRALVVNFFNPFCPPCREEQPVLEADWRRLREQGVQFVGVHYVGGQWPPSVSAARSYLERQGVTYPVLEDPDSSLAQALGIQGIPSTIVIDRKGELRYRILGRVKPGVLSDLLDQLSSAAD